ncbi:SUKH-3 domain-containing protein [Streptomyces sp. NPDC058548]|uniref:SUKH-3 domain-containing protein n=1 Tax=Streptomyces sp. NPDC058548 TaxID=3346545 RepID=UPI00365B9F38
MTTEHVTTEHVTTEHVTTEHVTTEHVTTDRRAGTDREAGTDRAAETDGVRGAEGGSALARAGWQPGRDAGDAAMIAVLETAGLGPWTLFPAAERAIRAFHGLRLEPAAHGGHEVAATGCVLGPQEARFSGASLHRLADTLGTRLFPLGRTDADAPMAVDEEGRLFTLGAGGAWLLGETVHDGLLALTEGRRPVRLRGREWRWPLRTAPGEPTDLAAGVRAALVAVYVLHTHGAFDARTLHVRATTLRGIGVTVLDQDFPLRPGALEESESPLVEAIEAELSALSPAASSCELLLSVPAPHDTAAPLSGLDCRVALGGSDGFALTLSTGQGASIGGASRVVDACVSAFDAWAGTTT